MRTKSRRAPDDYLALVQQYPLVDIRSPAECDAATAYIQSLAIKGEENLTAGEADYLHAMTDMIGASEDANPVPAAFAVTPISTVKFQMEEHGVTTSDLGRLLGSRSRTTAPDARVMPFDSAQGEMANGGFNPRP